MWGYISGMTTKQSNITKADDDQQIVYGEVYVPMVPDSDGEFMDADTIKAAAHKFLQNHNIHNVDKQHDNTLTGSYVVESFIAREGDPDFIEGAWVLGVQVPDKELWRQIKEGDINGFSLEATVEKTLTTLELQVPDVITGGTTEVEGHTHTFYVSFDEDGIFLGGHTDVVLGHSHKIVHGTETCGSQDHKHNFSFVEGM